MNNFSQEQIFFFFFIIGLIIGLMFDFFKALKKNIKSNDITTLVQDIIFTVLSGILIILGIIKLNNGEIRFYLFLGMLFGIIIYSLTISNMCGIILYEFVRFCKKILEIPYYCFKKTYIILKTVIKKDF